MKKLLWLDLETTGLDPEMKGDVVLELYACVTDPSLVVSDELHRTIAPTQEQLRLMNDEVWAWHSANGLLADVSRSHRNVSDVDDALFDFVKKNFGYDRPMLAGSSVHFDRRFLRTYFYRSEPLLHYRMVDVSSIAEGLSFYHGFSDARPHQTPTHRAKQDTHDVIARFGRLMELFDRSKMPKPQESQEHQEGPR